MNIVVRGKQFKVTDALREYAIKRVKKLEKYSDDFTEVLVMLSVEKGRQRVEVTAPLNGFLLRGEEETIDMYSSVDLVVEKLERQMEKYRKKLNRRRARGLRDQDVSPGTEGPNEDESLEQDAIVRTKKVQTKPMLVDEAVMQMNMIGHNFYMFINAESGQMNVVYCRKDGGYGLLEPEG